MTDDVTRDPDGADHPADDVTRDPTGHRPGHPAAETRDADEDEDDLPPRDDPYWAELTAETFAFLRRLRAAERRRRLGSTAYAAYVVLVVVVLYVVPYVWYALTRPSPAAAAQTAPAWAIGATGLAMFAVVAYLRDGAWRGPAVVDRPTAAWILPSPTHRRGLLVPRWRTALALAAVSGALLGGLLSVVARVVAGGDALLVAAAGAVGALLLGAGGTATSALAETGRPTLRRPTLLWLAPTVVVALAVLSTRAGAPRADYLAAEPSGAWAVVAAVLLWSGPWGWVVQPFVAALPGRAPGGVDALWPVGAALTALAVVALVVAAERVVPAIDGRTLRDRADSVALVGSAILSLQPRRARLTVLAAQGHAPSTRFRLPVPRRRALLPLWRDATALLRAPARIVWSLLWLAVAVVLLGEAFGPRPGAVVFDPEKQAAALAAASRALRGERLLVAVPGFVALYLAAAQLAEPARLDADDVRRLRIRPTAATRQALAHAIVPVAVLGAVLLAALGALWAEYGLQPFGAGSVGWFSYGGPSDAAPGGVLGGPLAVLGWHSGLLAALTALPLMVGAALVSAYRGEVPLTLLATGAGSPMGDPGPGALLAWYARAPLVALLLLLPTVLGWSVAGSVTWVGAVVMLTWAGMRAEAMLRA